MEKEFNAPISNSVQWINTATFPTATKQKPSSRIVGYPRIPYLSVGTESERFASHLTSRGTLFQRSPISAPELSIRKSWKVNLKDDLWFALSGPVLLDNGNVCQGTREGILCINPISGEKVWFSSTNTSIDTVLAVGEIVLSGGRDGKLVAWSSEDGSRLWETIAGDWVSSITSLGSDSIVYSSRDGHIRRISLATGHLLWSQNLNSRIFAQPCVDGNRIFVGARNGLFFALSSDTGEILRAAETGSDVHGAAVVAGDKVLFGSDDKRLYCVDRNTLEIRWMFRTGDAIWCRPCVAGKFVIFGSTDSYIYCVDLKTGNAYWENGTQGSIRLGVTLAGQTVCLANENGTVMLIDVPSGKVLGRCNLSGGVWAAPLYTQNGFLVATKGNELVNILNV